MCLTVYVYECTTSWNFMQISSKQIESNVFWPLNTLEMILLVSDLRTFRDSSLWSSISGRRNLGQLPEDVDSPDMLGGLT